MYKNHAIVSAFTFFCVVWMNEWIRQTKHRVMRVVYKIAKTIQQTLIQLSAWTWMISLRNWSFSSHRIIQSSRPNFNFIAISSCAITRRPISSVATANIRCTFSPPRLHDRLWEKTWRVLEKTERNESKVQWSSDIILLCHYWFFNDH